MATIAPEPTARLSAEDVHKIGEKARKAASTAETLIHAHLEAVAGLPVKELVKLARLHGLKVGHDQRTRPTLLGLLGHPEAP